MKISIKVKPNSIRSSVNVRESGIYMVELRSPAEKNKANLELIKILSKYFSVSSKNIAIKAGLSSRSKIVEIKNEV